MPQMQVWSCGGGTQSGAIAALIGDGILPTPDICFMVDTGHEKSGTWPFVDEFIRPQLARASCELSIVNAKDYATVGLFSTKGKVLIPGFTSINGTVGKLDPFCSNEWKQRVGMRWLRENNGHPCRIWLGISVDEIRRVRLPTVGWVTNFYPLVWGKDDPTTPNMKTRMTRSGCVDYVRLAGWKGVIPHSACKICPNMSDAEWLEMKIDWPLDFAEACRVEKDIQVVDPHFWLHPSCQPLETVDFTAPPTLCQHQKRTLGIYGAKVRDIAQEKRHYSLPKESRGAPVGVVLPKSFGFEAMQIDWMNMQELSESIPPVYAEFIGRHVTARLKEDSNQLINWPADGHQSQSQG